MRRYFYSSRFTYTYHLFEKKSGHGENLILYEYVDEMITNCAVSLAIKSIESRAKTTKNNEETNN